jgi:hypothetical protein
LRQHLPSRHRRRRRLPGRSSTRGRRQQDPSSDIYAAPTSRRACRSRATSAPWSPPSFRSSLCSHTSQLIVRPCRLECAPSRPRAAARSRGLHLTDLVPLRYIDRLSPWRPDDAQVLGSDGCSRRRLVAAHLACSVRSQGRPLVHYARQRSPPPPLTHAHWLRHPSHPNTREGVARTEGRRRDGDRPEHGHGSEIVRESAMPIEQPKSRRCPPFTSSSRALRPSPS